MIDFVYLPIEIKNREFHAKLLLATQCLALGQSVVVGRRLPATHAIFKDRKSAILYKSAAKVDEENFLRFAELGHNVYSLDEEGFLVDSLSFFVNKRFTSPNVRASTGVFCWGDVQAQALKEHYPEGTGKIWVSGNPRVDLWRNFYYGLYAREVVEIKKRYADYVFVPSTFAVTSPYKKEGVVERLRKLGFISGDADLKKFEALERSLVSMRSAFAEAIDVLSREFGKIFIIRPHPSEDSTFWDEYFDDHPFVRITDQYTVSPWVMGACAVLHNSCTTAIESGFYGVPTIAYLPSGQQHQIAMNFANVSSHRAEDLITLRALLRRAFDGDLAPQDWPETISGYLSDIDNSAQYIAQHLVKNSRETQILPFRVNYAKIAKFAFLRFLMRVGVMRNSKIVNEFRYRFAKFDRTSVTEVSDFVRLIAASLFPDLEFNVVEIEPNLFHLTKA
ncbi:surface carbohydrate biosynthesis protein [Pseudomonas caspiana]|uniref:surface carbohydrate biosynthesis protein n=1 Tax=Pseudomonas caspiana TaxID=1451454 RepID=UPI0032ED9B58